MDEVDSAKKKGKAKRGGSFDGGDRDAEDDEEDDIGGAMGDGLLDVNGIKFDEQLLQVG